MPAESTPRLVALDLPPGQDFVAALEAAWAGGDAVLPLDPAAPGAARRTVLDALRPDKLVTADGEHELTATAEADPALADAALVIATSGSTGVPKGACLSRSALEASARATAEFLGIGAADAWVSCLPWHHIGGLQVMLRARLLDTPLTVVGSAIEAVDVDASLVSLVPAQLSQLLDAGANVARWRAILLGGAAAPAALLERARGAGARVITTYGMSETCGGCVYDGRPLAGVTVTTDADSRLVIAGPVLMTGYRLDPATTAAAIGPDGLRTNDLGAVSPDGTVTVLGRADDVIVTGGENVAAQAVEDVLSAHPAIADVAVTAVTDTRFGQRVVAVVVSRAGAPDLADLADFVRARAPGSHVPRRLVLVPALPRLPSGKTDRLAVAALAAAAESPDETGARDISPL